LIRVAPTHATPNLASQKVTIHVGADKLRAIATQRKQQPPPLSQCRCFINRTSKTYTIAMLLQEDDGSIQKTRGFILVQARALCPVSEMIECVFLI
jgi:hypothetical protein